MRISRLPADAKAGDIRILNEIPASVEEDVRSTLRAVRDGGDAAVAEINARFDPGASAEFRVSASDLEAAGAGLDPTVADAIRTSAANVEALAEAQTGRGTRVELSAGQVVDVAEMPVARAAGYVPGGRAPYPSTLIMCAATARAAGVGELAICAPPGPDGKPHAVILGACSLLGVDEVYSMGGAQAVAALAYGTETIKPVDVLVGPGNSYVQEAKRQLVGVIGIDGVAGPSELVVVATGEVTAEPLVLDLLAQAEHGPDSLVALVTTEPGLADRVAELAESMAAERPSVTDAPLAIAVVADAAAAVALAEAVAPEHLQLVGEEAEALADQVRAAGCVFVGPQGATAFGDYIAGSNHVLPTGGAARFQSALSVSTFRRRMARVSFPGDSAGKLAPAGAALARAEGFPVHAESMEARA
jgi:histidinol dehydrogenase